MSSTRRVPVYAMALGIALACRCAVGQVPPEVSVAETPNKIATFSIVAMEPVSGVCGAAVASKYPAVGKVVPYAKGGVGAFCTQHYHDPRFGDRALELLGAERGSLPAGP